MGTQVCLNKSTLLFPRRTSGGKKNPCPSGDPPVATPECCLAGLLREMVGQLGGFSLRLESEPETLPSCPLYPEDILSSQELFLLHL